MIGLAAFSAAVLWVCVAVFIGWLASRFTTKVWLRGAIAILIAAVVLILPLVDEIIGKYQFDKYCENAREVKIHGSIPVGQDLYTNSGEWRLDAIRRMPAQEVTRLNKRIDDLIRWDLGEDKSRTVPAAIPVIERRVVLYERQSGRLLAEFWTYANYGGWLKRAVGIGAAAGGIMLPQSCEPELVREDHLTRRLLRVGDVKERSS